MYQLSVTLFMVLLTLCSGDFRPRGFALTRARALQGRTRSPDVAPPEAPPLSRGSLICTAVGGGGDLRPRLRYPGDVPARLAYPSSGLSPPASPRQPPTRRPAYLEARGSAGRSAWWSR